MKRSQKFRSNLGIIEHVFNSGERKVSNFAHKVTKNIVSILFFLVDLYNPYIKFAWVLVLCECSLKVVA